MRIILTEMALSRHDAVDKCIGIGKMFVIHFDKIYKNPNSIDVPHWCTEMQNWFNEMNDILLKSNNKHLNSFQRKDWFYSFGSSYEEYFNEDPDEVETYEVVVDLLEENKSVQKTIEEIFYKE